MNVAMGYFVLGKGRGWGLDIYTMCDHPCESNAHDAQKNFDLRQSLQNVVFELFLCKIRSH